MTVLSKRRGEESRKDYDTLYNVHTPASASMPDLASGHQRSISRHSNHPGDPYTPAPRHPRRRPSHASQGSTSKSLRRVSTQNQDGGPHMFQVGSPTRRSGSIMRVRTRDEDLIPELPRFTHRINLSGRDSILISPSPVPEPVSAQLSASAVLMSSSHTYFAHLAGISSGLCGITPCAVIERPYSWHERQLLTGELSRSLVVLQANPAVR
jgi:hypothetical protein